MTAVGRTTSALLAAVATTSLAAAPCVAQIDPSTVAALDRYVEVQRHRMGWPGAALAVATADSVVLARGYGEGAVSGEPVTARTPFPLGSVTKTFTALAVARLAEEGRVELDAPLETYLPDVELRAPFEPGSITVRHLLHHRSGLSTWDGHDPVAQREGRVDHLAPVAPPGGDAEYSSLNYILLGRIVEAVTGEPYGAHLHRVLLDPLDMRDAWVMAHDVPPPGRVQGHRNLFGFDVGADEPTPSYHLVPAGFVAASARDVGRYTAMLLGGGSFDGTRIVAPETVERIFAPMDSTGPAMAWGRGRHGDAVTYGHAGNARTAAARVLLTPERGYAVSLMVNTNAGPLFAAPADVVEELQNILAGHEPSTLLPRERFFKAFLLVATLIGVGAAVRHGVRWHRAGRPVSLDLDRGATARLAFDVAGAAFVVFGLPRVIGVPLPTLLEYFPDIGGAMVAAAGAGVLGGVLRAFTASR